MASLKNWADRLSTIPPSFFSRERRSASYRLRLLATGQLEAGNARLPARRRRYLARQRVVLVNVPEGAVVRRVDRHVGIVAPPRVGRPLHPGPVDDRAFAQSHLAKGVALQPAGVPNARIDIGRINDAVAESHVTLLILRDAAHPAMDAVPRRICALLVDGVGAAGPPDLVPARTSDAGQCLYRLIGHQRFVRAKVAIAEAEGRTLAVRENVEVLCSVGDSWLREAVAGSRRAWVDRVEGRDWQLCF